MAQMSLRNPFVAGVAAAIGAGVVTVAPAAHVPALPTTAAVALAGFDNPIEELIGTADLVQTYLTAAYYYDKGTDNWPFAGMDQTGGDLLNDLLFTQKGLGYYHNVGLVPEIVNTHQPILTQLFTNWLGYLNTGLSGVAAAGTSVAAGVWNFPQAVIDSVKLAINGDVQAAIKLLVSAVTVPLAGAASALFNVASSVISDVFTRLAAVVKVIPTNLTLFGGWAIGGGTLLVKDAVALGTEWVKELSTANFEGAWNTAVGGLLGPAGLPGVAFNGSLGAGIQTGPILTPADVKGNYIPSLRTAIQGTLWNTQDALTAQATGTAASTPALAAAEAPAEEPTAPAEAPAEAPEASDAAAEPAVTSAAPKRVRLKERVAAARANLADKAAAPAKAHRAAREQRAAAGN